MKKALIFLITDFEETEAVATIDLLKRANIEVLTVSLSTSLLVKGSHNIKITADVLFDNAPKDFDMLIFPGGPGSKNYMEHKELLVLLKEANKTGKYISAICAAPVLLAKLGILENKRATCYPGCEAEFKNVHFEGDSVVIDKNIITAKGPGKTFEFSLKIIETLCGKDVCNKVKKEFII